MLSRAGKPATQLSFGVRPTKTMKTAYSPAADESKAASAKFRYELLMFRHAHDLLNTIPAIDATYNITLEAALLHLRNLYDFFCSPPTHQDDIQARHFTTHPLTTIHSCLSAVAARQDDINKSLSHLTYTRTKKKPSWNMDAFREEIENAYQAFLALVPADERSEWPA